MSITCNFDKEDCEDRKSEKKDRDYIQGESDPDIAGIVPGPQPLFYYGESVK